MDQLHRNARRERWLGRVGREIDEHRPQPLAAGGERVLADRRHRAGMALNRRLETLFEIVEVGHEPGDLTDGGERGHLALAVWSATMPPANVR